jgi:hypothetical protein
MASFDADSHPVKAKTDPAEFERQKWETDVAFRERELRLKEVEVRPKFYKNPVLVSALGLVSALLINQVGEAVNKFINSRDIARREQLALIEKTLEDSDPDRARDRLQLLLQLQALSEYSTDLGSIVNGQDPLVAFGNPTFKANQASLILKAMETDDRKKIMEKLALLDRAGLIPDYEKTTRIADVLAKELEAQAAAAVASAPPTAPTAASVAAPAAATPPVPTPVAATSTGPTTCSNEKPMSVALGGWIFLGRMNKEKTAWVVSESGIKTIAFEDASLMDGGPDILTKLVGKCLQTLKDKSVRVDSVPGTKVDAPWKRSLPRQSRVRIVEVDAAGIDEATSSKYPVIWAKVEVLSEARY